MERLWAGWRSSYLETADDAVAPGPDGCVFCGLLASGRPDEETHVVWRSPLVVAILNAFPYGSGHLLVMPSRHVGDLADVAGEERAAMWDGVHAAVAAVTAAYRPGGVNVGANLGRAAGAGIPGHLHVHVLPRWDGDTNFMTSVAETRVLPEPLAETWRKLQAAWPSQAGPAA
jgi:ATP adenylyltransferase